MLTEEIKEQIKDKTVTSVLLERDMLIIDFAEISMSIYDTPSCCEDLYFTTDDNLKEMIGAKILGMDLLETITTDGGSNDVHEVAFMHIRTDKGTFTIEAHNESNGFYCGIYPVVYITMNPRAWTPKKEVNQ